MILSGHFKLTDCTQTELFSCLALMDDLSAAVTVRLIFKVFLFHFLSWETAMCCVLSNKLQAPPSQNITQISFVLLLFHHLMILLIFLLLLSLLCLDLPCRVGTRKIISPLNGNVILGKSSYLGEYFLEIVVNVQSVAS